MTDFRRLRFMGLMAELDAAYAEYRKELDVSTTPLGGRSPETRQVDWDAWDRAKNRYDKAHDAVVQFLRGGGDEAQ